jgi:hypothetical protein
MKTILTCFGSMFLLAATASLAQAGDFQQYPQPYGPMPAPVMPCGGGSWIGQGYGQGYIGRPPFGPFNGMLPAPPQANNGFGNGCPFPQHPYAHGPRDFFMYYDRGPY